MTSDLSLAQNAREALIAEKAAYQQRQAEIAAAQQAAAEQAAAEAQAQALAQQQAQAEAAAQEQAAQEQVTRESQLAEQPAPAAEEAKPAAPTTEAEATESQAPEAPASETPAAEESTVAETPSTQEEESTTPAPQPAQEAPAAEEEPEAPAATTEEEPAAAAPAASTYGDVLSTAAKYVGTPYVWGGKSPSGFDCSGFVQYVFKEAYGIDVGSWTVPQESAGTRISVSEAQAGDLYFWGDAGSTYHVAIATGGGNFIHASQPGTPLGYNNIQNFTPQFAVRVR